MEIFLVTFIPLIIPLSFHTLIFLLKQSIAKRKSNGYMEKPYLISLYALKNCKGKPLILTKKIVVLHPAKIHLMLNRDILDFNTTKKRNSQSIYSYALLKSMFTRKCVCFHDLIECIISCEIPITSCICLPTILV